MSKLLIRDPKGNEREHELLDDITTIGRGSQNVIQAKDSEASRQHCRIEKSGSGYRVVDNRSRNGTKVNGQKVDIQDLRPGDVITIGDFTMTFDPKAEVGAAEDEDFVGTIEVAPISEKELSGPSAGGAGGKPQFVLDIVEGSQKGQVLELGPESLTIGRNKSNKFAIDDESASSFHAEIVKEPTGYFVTDLGSTNGTKVGGEKIVKTRLSPGAEIEIGTTKMVFKNVGAPAEEDEIFGTVVLDAEKLERELAEDEMRARRAFIRRVAIAAAVLLVVVGLYFLISALARPAGPRHIAGNLLKNFSFDGPLTDTGDPNGWRSVTSQFTPWEVSKDADHYPVKEKKGLLIVSREPEARPDEYTECRTRAPLDIRPDKAYRLGGFIKTEGAQGIYGFRLRWLGRAGDDRRAVDQVYVRRSHTRWREVKRKGAFTPPMWASRAEVSCFAVGNRGKVYFDDVYLVAESVTRRPNLTQAFGRIRAEFSPSGVFAVKSGAGPAVRGGELFLVGEQEATSSQEFADAEEPQQEARSSAFAGTVPEFITYGAVRYREQGRPGELGVVIEYELSADRPVSLDRAGIRFTVTGSFGAGKTQVFGPGGLIEEDKATGLVEGAREVLFTNVKGEKFAVYIRGEGRLRLDPRGNEKLVEVLLPASAAIGRHPVKLGIEFNRSSRIERVGIGKLWKDHRAAVDAKDFAAQWDALKEIVALADQFPKDAGEARTKLASLTSEAEADIAAVKELFTRAKASVKVDAVRKTLLSQAAEKIASLKGKYTSGEFAAKVNDLDVEKKKIEADVAMGERNEQAEKLLIQVLEFMRGKNYELAIQILKTIEINYSDTGAAKKAKARDIRGTIDRELKLVKQRDDVYRRSVEKIRNYYINAEFDTAISILKADAEFQRFRDYPRFRALMEELQKKAAEKARAEVEKARKTGP